MTPLALLATVLLVLANAFFVAAEFAIVKTRPTRLAELAKTSRRARMALDISKHLDAYLSANQVGITLASLALGWVGEPAFERVLAPLFGTGEIAGVATRTVAMVVSFTVITTMHTVLGELVPKSLAIQFSEAVALWTAPPLRAFYVLAFPLIWTLNQLSSLVLKLFGLRAASEVEMLHSPEELRLVLRQVSKLEAGARGLIDRVLDYTHRVARHVMTLRRDVVVLEEGQPFDHSVEVIIATQYTRYPVVDPRTDQVLGYVHIKDLTSILASGRKPISLKEIVRQPLWATEDTSLEQLRREFQRTRIHIAVIAGKDGAFQGIVTLEDLIEEFVGEIQDEQDQEEVPPIVRQGDGSFEVDGRVTLDVIARDLHLDVPAPTPEMETLAGLVVAHLGELPAPGKAVQVADARLTIVDVRDGRIRRLRVERTP